VTPSGAISQRIAEVLQDEGLGDMERSVLHADLQIQYCLIRMQEADTADEEIKWSGLAEKWEGRKKMAVISRANDLLPKILANQTRNQDINGRLAQLAEDVRRANEQAEAGP
jgi:hypothetical protein